METRTQREHRLNDACRPTTEDIATIRSYISVKRHNDNLLRNVGMCTPKGSQVLLQHGARSFFELDTFTKPLETTNPQILAIVARSQNIQILSVSKKPTPSIIHGGSKMATPWIICE